MCTYISLAIAEMQVMNILCVCVQNLEQKLQPDAIKELECEWLFDRYL